MTKKNILTLRCNALKCKKLLFYHIIFSLLLYIAILTLSFYTVVCIKLFCITIVFTRHLQYCEFRQMQLTRVVWWHRKLFVFLSQAAGEELVNSLQTFAGLFTCANKNDATQEEPQVFVRITENSAAKNITGKKFKRIEILNSILIYIKHMLKCTLRIIPILNSC